MPQNFKQKNRGFIQRTAIYFVVRFFVCIFASKKKQCEYDYKKTFQVFINLSFGHGTGCGILVGI